MIFFIGMYQAIAKSVKGEFNPEPGGRIGSSQGESLY